MAGLDTERLRADFPALDSGIAFFDAPGGTQTPRQVGEAIASTLTAPLSNRGVQSVSERNAERVVEDFRQAFADLLGADPRGIVYGRSATQLTYDFAKHLSQDWGPGDEVVVTRLDHDSNVRPWVQAAERVGARLRWIDVNPDTGELATTDLGSVLSESTRLVAVSAASNLIGTIPDVAAIAEAAHRVGALVYVDGVHYAAHHHVDISALGADFFVCSPYKFLGPHCALLAAAPQVLESLTPEKLLPSPNQVPERFEFGTLPYEVMAGATAAVDYIAALAGEAGRRRDRLKRAHELINAHEQALAARILQTVQQELHGRVEVHSKAQRRTPTLFLSFSAQRAQDVSAALHRANIQAPAGSFYAYETFRQLALPDTGGLRLGMAPYTNDDDVDRLLETLTSAVSAAIP
ncbi:cysteine desulfurase-like protein [Nesterenkonia sphaerica]|uniref:Cysteine desulfurase-like protein n=1 Tax=Nesterenkonia sphaerica TaxID=1804988 RepID=A0A5R9AKG6_9MICC|nr:cysteine desulfurase-like protein [Nesterenkonia sphaerica]TLP78940.1 cysteine desulfurase-like protein [Nesterenkonia sphaerica]